MLVLVGKNYPVFLRSTGPKRLVSAFGSGLGDCYPSYPARPPLTFFLDPVLTIKFELAPLFIPGLAVLPVSPFAVKIESGLAFLTEICYSDSSLFKI
jgi:hypothetical protein